MSALPPYSTYRTDTKQQLMYPQQLSHGNVLTFTPPGFKQTLHVKFPDSRLAVCEKCKKNYKTRDMCRVRNAHTEAPWTTAYICITLDDSCTDEDGNYVDKPFSVRMIQWQPFCVKSPFDPKTPVCSACKKTNRTRSFCRERHKHKQLPWCTVYVLLSPSDTIDPSTRVAPESIPLPKLKDTTKADQHSTDEKVKTSKIDMDGDDDENKETDLQIKEDPDLESNNRKNAGNGEESDDGDDINDIASSRTFLSKVSCRHSSIHWLELTEYDAADLTAMQEPPMTMGQRNPPVPPPIDPAQYYTQMMTGYSAQQHQLNLKSQQQYFFEMQQRNHQAYAAQWQQQQQQQQQQYSHLPAIASATQGVPTSLSAPAFRVTAGEMASQHNQKSNNQKQLQNNPNEPSSAGAAAAAAAVAAAAQSQPQLGHSWAAYHHHMYQNQMAQFQQAGGLLPQQGGGLLFPMSSSQLGVEYSHTGHHEELNNSHGESGVMIMNGNQKENDNDNDDDDDDEEEDDTENQEENDRKRSRFV